MNNPETNFNGEFLPGISFFGFLTLLFWFLILTLGLYILIYLYIRNRREAKFKRWKFISDTIIRSAIFWEETEETPNSGNSLLRILEIDLIPLPDRLKKLLHKPYFRRFLAKEVLSAKQNLSGTADVNLKNLFKQFKLDHDALKMLNSRSWYIKALGIQQMGIMEMNDDSDKILKYTNDKRGLLRVEAQNALVKFHGFEGLRFLDHAAFPISEWQQMKLLEELSDLSPDNFTGIDVWLKSTNDTVVIFALKLVKNYHRFELYNEIIACLIHPNPEVRRQAIYATKEIQTGDTADQLIVVYTDEILKNKLAIIKVLAAVGTEKEISFLLSLLDEEHYELIIAAARALAAIGADGMLAFQSHPKGGTYPLMDIINQIKAETK